MTWREFLTTLSGAPTVTVVGPMATGAVRPKGPTVFVDGGLRLRESGAPEGPVVSVGDGDSGDLPLDHRLPADKDYSDLAFVLKELPLSVTQLQMIGFLGGRRDHELANFAETHRFLDARPTGARVDFWGADGVEVIGLTGRLTLEVNGIFSVFTFAATEIEIGGDCRYPLAGQTLSPVSSHGLSNVGAGQVRFAAKGPCFIFLNAGA